VPTFDLRLDGTFHDAPLAHAELVAFPLLVERFHGALEDVVAQRLAVGASLAGAGGLDDLHVEALVGEETLVAGHQERHAKVIRAANIKAE
jgi:hypothetical protein